MKIIILLYLLVAAASLSASAGPNVPQMHVGQCVNTTVSKVGTRLIDTNTGQNISGSGSAVTFANGIYVVSYDDEPNAEASRRGDVVRVCLVSVPKDCPKGDNRGKVYKVTDMRTHLSFTLPDAEHMCGGA